MMEYQQTPRPWRIEDMKIIGANGATVAKLTPLDMKNAELIVTSVNSCAALASPVAVSDSEIPEPIQPTYFVHHPDDSYSEANPQPVAASLLKRALRRAPNR